jgi:undecaprenyl-diphosphatase
VAVVSAVLAAGTGIGMFLSLKRLAGRKRPCHIEPHCWAKLLPPDQFSFPSGHSITAFAVAIPLSLFYPTLMIGLLFCAASIALSRILLGMHFLSDVVVGSVLGASLGYCSYILFN